MWILGLKGLINSGLTVSQVKPELWYDILNHCFAFFKLILRLKETSKY